ncbi:MAG: site-specific DNA-methyltransferase [Chlamydiota bacterium]
MERLKQPAKKTPVEKIEKLKALFPETVTEGKIDFDLLRRELGDSVDTMEERYSFNWNGKRAARLLAHTAGSGTLRPCRQQSAHWTTTRNLFIEGDNLEVLKLLRKSYYKKVKMIYIDPPYNTGKDFIYKDDFKQTLKHYKRITGQLDSEGKELSSNPETGGRYHTDWLNMIYPRLKLARNLLREDGVIFISIDDNEVHNLRKVCDKIFGEENFIAQFIWKRRTSSAMASNNVSLDQDYVVCYQKGALEGFKGWEKNFKKYSNPDHDPRGPWVLDNLTVGMNASMRPNQYYDLVDPKTKKVYPCNPNRVWAFIPESMDKMIEEGRIVFPDHPSNRPMQKRFKRELKSNYNPFSTLLLDRVGLNMEATKQVQQLMGIDAFDYPKPLSLMKILISQVSCGNDIILDFFAGSATTAHAVMKLNAEQGRSRRFIMVQLPEACDKKSEAYKAGYRTVADIGKERIRRAAEKIGREHPEYRGDLGFKVFKLDSTNIKPWEVGIDLDEERLEALIDPIKPYRTDEDLLYEVLLNYGLELTLPIDEQIFDRQKVWNIGRGALVLTLSDAVSLEVVAAIARLENVERVVFKDAGFKTDSIKVNALQLLKSKGIGEVKSI